MTVAILHSRARIGIVAPLVTIEVFISGGLPVTSLVGMPATAVRESKDRVRGAIMSSGFNFPLVRITASLGPADMPKTGGRFDLAIALGILAASGQVDASTFDAYEFYGELALNGDLRRIPGVLPAALKAAAAGKRIIVPLENGSEAALVSDDVHVARNLAEVAAHLKGGQCLPVIPRTLPPPATPAVADIADVRGQAHAKRALEIAAAGGHNLLFTGPPGTGKSMMAARLPGLLPPMSEAEAIETAAVDSVLGRAPDLENWCVRPFRAPHHTASAAALIGGGSEPRPGEVSRAHNGVLFLDELPEFSRNVLEVLREPLEAGHITISRASRQDDFPAAFQLVAAMNPCPCGYLGDEGADCACSGERVANYRSRISGPLLDRIDMCVQVGRPSRKEMCESSKGAETSAMLQRRVVAARHRQLARDGACNARLDVAAVEKSCRLTGEGLRVLDTAADRFGLSVRGYQRVQRVARTIADLAGVEQIEVAHVAEAISLRGLDTRVRRRW